MAWFEEQPGLRLRVGREARRLDSQHRQLETFYAMVVESVTSGSVERVRSEFLRFHDALEAHFMIEERIHFPALHGLRPELDTELAELVVEHRYFRDRLDRLAKVLENAGIEEGGRQLNELVGRLSAHELREEQLVKKVAEEAQSC